MPKVGKKEFPYTKAGMAAANLAAAKSGKKVTKVAGMKARYADKMQSSYSAATKAKKAVAKKAAPGKMYAGGSRDFDERTGTYRSTGTKRSPNMPKRGGLEKMPRIKQRGK